MLTWSEQHCVFSVQYHGPLTALGSGTLLTSRHRLIISLVTASQIVTVKQQWRHQLFWDHPVVKPQDQLNRCHQLDKGVIQNENWLTCSLGSELWIQPRYSCQDCNFGSRSVLEGEGPCLGPLVFYSPQSRHFQLHRPVNIVGVGVFFFSWLPVKIVCIR